MNYVESTKTINVRISFEAWNHLRWAKYNAKAKSYSDLIITLDESFRKNPSKSYFEIIYEKSKIHDAMKQVENKSSDKSTKTILLNTDAHRRLEKVKLILQDHQYTFSDAIQILLSVSSE